MTRRRDVGQGAALPGRMSEGQGIVEFGLILAIAALVALVALVLLGPQLAVILDFIGAQVQQPA